MKHHASQRDLEFQAAFESCAVTPAEFNHRGHLRLAYVYLTRHDTEAAYRAMRDGLHVFLAHHRVAPGKYHDTMTRAWILAVRHFMEATPGAGSAEAFIDANPRMLDAKIMLTHYSAEVMFSDEARAGFVEPDLDPIPRYDD